jgi:putative tricarboxylic transport membrane protein
LTIPGIALGMLGGSIPGVSSALILAIVLPATLWMNLLPALIFMTAIYTGAAFGAAIPAILMGVPGSPAAVATSFDGYPMTQRGDHNLALGLALASSTLGHMGAYLILFIGIGVISHAVLKLGPLEMLLLMLWGLTLIAALRGRYMSRSLLSGLIGVLIATIGLSPRDVVRGTFNLPGLLDGIPAVAAMIGLFAASELFNLAGTSYLVQQSELRRVRVGEIARGMLLAMRHPIVILRGLVIGATIGGLPGVGAAVCNLVSYAETRRGDKHPETFGKGNPKGVIAAEAGNASSEAGSMATLLALGIPGGASSAVMLAALSLHDVTGGPQFLDSSKDVVYAIILNNFAQGAVMLALGLGLIGLMANVIRIPVRILIPVILVLATFGSYSLTGSMVGPITMVVFGFIGWFMQRHDYSVPACVVGLILGGKVETTLLQTYQISGGGQIGYFLGRPIALVLLALLLFSLFGRSIAAWWRRQRAKPERLPQAVQ